MRAYSAAIIAEQGLTVRSPGRLIEIDMTTPLFFSTVGGVSWNGLAWANKGVQVSYKFDGSAKIAAQIIVPNEGQAFSSQILLQGIANVRIRIWEVYAGATASGDPYLAFDGDCGAATITAERVTVQCAMANVSNTYSPRKRCNASVGVTVWMPAGKKINTGTSVWTIDRK